MKTIFSSLDVIRFEDTLQSTPSAVILKIYIGLAHKEDYNCAVVENIKLLVVLEYLVRIEV